MNLPNPIHFLLLPISEQGGFIEHLSPKGISHSEPMLPPKPLQGATFPLRVLPLHQPWHIQHLPQTESSALGTPVSRRPGGDGSASPEVSGSLQAADGKLEKGTRSLSRGVTRSPRGPGKNWSPGGPPLLPSVDFDDPKSRAQRPLFLHSLARPLPPTPALGREPGKRRS